MAKDAFWQNHRVKDPAAVPKGAGPYSKDTRAAEYRRTDEEVIRDEISERRALERDSVARARERRSERKRKP